MHSPSRLRARLTRAAGVIVGLGLFAATLAKLDVGAVVGHMRALGPAALLILLPYPLLIGFDALAWSHAFARIGRTVHPGTLLRARFILKALGGSLAGGPVIAEAFCPLLLHRLAAVPAHETVVSMALRKVLVVLANGVYLALGVFVGMHFLERQSHSLLGMAGLEWLGLGCAAVLTLGAIGSAVLLVRGGVAERLHALLMHVPWERWRRGVARRHEHFVSAGQSLVSSLGLEHHRLVMPTLLLLGCWLLEALESWLILALLGTGISFGQALTMEATISFLRSLAFFVPAGLGVQDAGYVAFLDAYGAAGGIDTAGAFVLLKRAKEVAWIAFGYFLFARHAGGRRGESASAQADASSLASSTST